MSRDLSSRLEYLESSGAVFAAAVSGPAQAGDRQATMLALRGVARAPRLLHARVIDLRGAQLASIGAGVVLDGDVRFTEGKRPAFLAMLSARTIVFERDVIHGGAPVGTLTLVADNADFAGLFLGGLFSGVAIIFVGAGLGLAFAVRMLTATLKPLSDLTQSAERIARTNDYRARVPLSGDDELGRLGEGFNRMLDAVEARDQRILSIAMSDPETDLPSRTAFEQRLESWHANGGSAWPVAVAAVRVCRFGALRSAVGFEFANDVITEIGIRLQEAGEAVFVCRLSTSTLGLMLRVTDDPRDAEDALHRILDDAAAPIRLGSHRVDVGLKAGFALWGRDGSDPRTLLNSASDAVEFADGAQERVVAYDAGRRGDPARNLSLMSDMREALASGHIRLFLQPKADLATGAFTQCEALLRWRDPVRGFVSPDDFVTLAEETGAIAMLTSWCVDEAIRHGEMLLQAGHRIKIAVNISGSLIGDAAFVNELAARCELSRSKLSIEITETAVIADGESAIRNVEMLTSRGIGVAIDDYGVGLSSLEYLKRIPAQELKIDKSYILDMDEAPRHALLVRSTIDLAHSLGMKVTAEGVETEAIARRLREMGCDMAQGYFYAKPMEAAALVAFLDEAERTAAA